MFDNNDSYFDQPWVVRRMQQRGAATILSSKSFWILVGGSGAFLFVSKLVLSFAKMILEAWADIIAHVFEFSLLAGAIILLLVLWKIKFGGNNKDVTKGFIAGSAITMAFVAIFLLIYK